jgi:predicted helicase
LESAVFNQVTWSALNPPETKDYWFVKKDLSEANAYNRFIKITEIFDKYVSGIKTSHDDFCLKYSLTELNDFREELLSKDVHVIRNEYKIKDGRDWTLNGATYDIKTAFNPATIYYRPFDYRYTSLSKHSKGFLDLPRYDIMRHFDNRDNVGIVFVRNFTSPQPYTNILISQHPIENRITHSFACSAFIAPLYVYGENLDGEHPGEITKIPNFTRSFAENYLRLLTWKPAPEDILAYIYAVLHSKIYREKYIVFLKTGFPAVPMTKNKNVFAQYAELGKKLIELHLLKRLPADTSIRVSLGDVKGDFCIDKLTYANSKIHLSVSLVNQSSRGGLITFEGVTPDIFDFEIGSRKPIDLWIKNRIKDRAAIAVEDLQHIKNMIIAIKQTISVMAEIELLGEEYLNDKLD